MAPLFLFMTETFLTFVIFTTCSVSGKMLLLLTTLAMLIKLKGMQGKK